jgi:hypothetical protein
MRVHPYCNKPTKTRKIRLHWTHPAIYAGREIFWNDPETGLLVPIFYVIEH